MNGYLWYTGGTVAHHIRASSVEEVRERIAALHGAEIAERAIIKQTRDTGDRAAA